MTDDVRYLDLPDGRRIAHRFTPGSGPALVFLPGYMSDMDGSKATAVYEWARANGRPCLLLDYSGCGKSSGDFANGTLSRWAAEVAALIQSLQLPQVVLIGSSMGGWLMLLLARAFPSRIAGLVGIAAAPDFTDWGIALMDKALLADGQTIFEDNPYGPEPTPTHPGFWMDGQLHRVLGSAIPFDGPVRLLHGQLDEDVPWELSGQVAEAVRSADVQVVLIKDGDHRLSRESDIALLLHVLTELLV
ncbi:hydrolase [Novosphingobium sp. Rr 2-17]|uniref:alpha/beta fold hydrolase n=1 Tax=Novosphingobium sp. Rr 2-17 TaxID=555793 RepID=UPI000269A4FC|nr:alpha/beta hydrolase [Novosphingobium sp. Rr 2-17]EIZ79177.1 hydrolase [Novosphingobium sp. Rr 2-17]